MVLSEEKYGGIAITAIGMIAMNLPITPVTYINGKNAIIVVATEAQTAGSTSAVPSMDALTKSMPLCRFADAAAMLEQYPVRWNHRGGANVSQGRWRR